MFLVNVLVFIPVPEDDHRWLCEGTVAQRSDGRVYTYTHRFGTMEAAVAAVQLRRERVIGKGAVIQLEAAVCGEKMGVSV